MAYSFDQLVSFAEQGGFPASVAPTMAAIAMAESSGNNVVQQGQPYGSTGWGLWQITPGNSEPQFGTDQALLDPVANAKAAYAKYISGGLDQWTTYTSGAYTQYLNGNNPAGNATGAGLDLNPLDAIKAFLKPFQDIATFFEDITKVVQWFFNLHNWARIAGGALGIVMCGVGAYMVLTGKAPHATNIAVNAAGAALK